MREQKVPAKVGGGSRMYLDLKRRDGGLSRVLVSGGTWFERLVGELRIQHHNAEQWRLATPAERVEIENQRRELAAQRRAARC